MFYTLHVFIIVLVCLLFLIAKIHVLVALQFRWHAPHTNSIRSYFMQSVPWDSEEI